MIQLRTRNTADDPFVVARLRHAPCPGWLLFEPAGGLTASASGVCYSSVEFIETPTFTRLIGKLMDDDEYAKLQLALVRRLDWGKVIQGSAGLRKLRWAGSGRGKRGGLRIIYYWHTDEDQIWLLLLYPKSEQEDLSYAEVQQLKRLVQEFEL
jgi:hypothetical protein